MPIFDSKHERRSRVLSRALSRAFSTAPIASKGLRSRGRYKFAAPMSAPVHAPFEQLEKRLLYSVSYDANGWTVVTPSVNSKIIYVAPGGSDSNSGLSESTPIKTFKHA